MPVDLLSGQNNEREPIDLLAPTQPDAPDMPLISSKDIEERFNIIRQFAGPDIEKKARDAASIAATFNIPESTAFDMRDSFFQKMDTTNIWDKATGSFKAGWGDVYSSVGGIMKRKGLAVGDTYVDFGERLKRAYIPPSDQSEFTWRKMKDPEWYATTIMRSVPFSLSLLPAALVGAYAAGTAGGVMGLGLFGKTVLGAIGGSALARPIESSFEAQGAYEEAKDKGLSDADAEIAANQVFLDNMKLSGLDAAEFATAFLPMGKIAGNTVKRAMGKRILAATGKTSAKLGAVGAMEMMEERYQEKAVMNALGDPASLFDFDDPRLNEAGAAGAVFGVGLAGTGSVWTALRDKVTVTDDKKVKFIYDKTKKQALAGGANVVEAGRIALDAVAATPEGKAHIERVVGDLVDLANGKPAKERTEAKTASDQPFIFGVNEDQNGEVTSFTMADPMTGNTFEVPAIEKEGEKDTVKYIPDPEALSAEMEKINTEDIDDKIDRLIEGDDTVIEQIFGEDVPNFEADNDLAPAEIVEPGANAEGKQSKIYVHETNVPVFDKFDMSKIGTGQGESWLGKGIYLNEKGSFKIEKYGKNTIEATLSPDANIFEIKDTPNGKYRDNFVEYAVENNIGSARELAEQRIKEGLPLDNLLPRDILKNNPSATEQLKKAGFDGLLEDGELVVYNPEKLITKAQEGKGTKLNENQDIFKEPSLMNRMINNERGAVGSDLTKTENFKKWFGNSKVVDENGNPLVVYHGTGKDFTEFTYDKIYSGEGASQSGSGFYFTTSKESGENYKRLSEAKGENGRILDVYLSIKKPLEIDFRDGEVSGAKINLTKNIVKKIILSVPNIKNVEDSPLQNWGDVEYEGFNKIFNQAVEAYADGNNIAALRNDFFGNDYGAWLKSLGTATGYDGAFSKLDDGVVHWVAWYPEQIKSASKNSGAFSKDNPNIFYSGLDITQTLDVLRGLTNNIKEAMPHLEALGRNIYESGKVKFNEWSAAIKETLGDLWESFKDVMGKVWAKLQEERGSISTKKIPSTTDINMMLSAASRQDAATGENITPESYMDLRAQAAQIAFQKIDKKLTKKQRREAARLARMGEEYARELPVFAAMTYIVNRGGLSLKSVQADYDGDTIRELMNRRLGMVSKNGMLAPDEIADDFGFESGDDLINAILDWEGLKAQGKKLADDFFDYYEKALTAGEAESFREQFDKEEKKALDQLTKKYKPRSDRGIKKEIRSRTGQVQAGDRLVTEYDALTEAFRKEAQIARYAFASGKKVELEKSKEKMRWLIRRRQSLKNVRDYFNMTDAEFMSVTNRRNPALMDNYEYKRFLSDIEQKAVELAENRQAKIELMMLIESKRLKKVDNYRQAMQFPTIDKMTTDQLREFAKLLEPFQDDDIFLTKRELETVDRTNLEGVKTIREALERLAKEAKVSVEELNKVKVAALDQFRFDTALRERDPFFDVLVTRMTEAKLGAELRAHNIESKVYELAKKAYKSRKRGIIARMIPQDDLIMAFLEAPADRKAAIAGQMTPEEINYASFIQQYFSEALDYLIATKGLERGRENYFVHIRRSFLENLKDGGLKKAFSELFKTYQQDQIVFNILDDDTGNILPLEKFFQFSLQRTDTMDPTRNVTKAFLTYVRTFEKKKMFDAIIPKLDIYAQALTPTKYTPLGLEIDRSLKRFVNKWINNKKGRRISFDSVIRQGGPLDVGIRALRTFTTMLDLGLSPIVQIASFLGEQVANAENLGTRYMAIGTARMNTDKGKRIIAKYEAFVGRSLWEDFTAPGKEVTERLSDILFSGFHVSTVLANKQFLLASLSEEEWKNEEISTERLAEMQLDLGRFRVVPGTGSLVGSTSVGDAAMQYKKWAVPIARTMIDDGEKLIRSIKEGKSLDNRTKKELIRFAYLTGAVFIVGAMAGADDTDDESYIGKFKARMYREAMTLTQGIDPLLFVGVPRTWTWVKDTIKALKDLVMLEEYKTKEGLKGVGELKRQFVPGVVRSLPGGEEKE